MYDDLIEITIKVGDYELKNGKRWICRECPVALGFQNVIKPEYYPVVGPYRLYVGIYNDKKVIHHITLPEIAQVLIDEFDQGLVTRPISFPVHLPKFLIKEQYLAS